MFSKNVNQSANLFGLPVMYGNSFVRNRMALLGQRKHFVSIGIHVWHSVKYNTPLSKFKKSFCKAVPMPA